MEPEIGKLYESNKKQFERVARRWTWRYAMHDALFPEPSPYLPLPLHTSCGPSAQVREKGINKFVFRKDGLVLKGRKDISYCLKLSVTNSVVI